MNEVGRYHEWLLDIADPIRSVLHSISDYLIPTSPPSISYDIAPGNHPIIDSKDHCGSSDLVRNPDQK